MKTETEFQAMLNRAEREGIYMLDGGKYIAKCGGTRTEYPHNTTGRDAACRHVRSWRIDRALQLRGIEDDADAGDIDPERGYWRDTVRAICRHLGVWHDLPL
jgi:hypothetical protein